MNVSVVVTIRLMILGSDRDVLTELADDPDLAEKLLSGKLDTPAAACIDLTHSPRSEPHSRARAPSGLSRRHRDPPRYVPRTRPGQTAGPTSPTEPVPRRKWACHPRPPLLWADDDHVPDARCHRPPAACTPHQDVVTLALDHHLMPLSELRGTRYLYMAVPRSETANRW